MPIVAILLLLLLALLLVVVVLGTVLWRRRGGGRTGEAVCGRCGYIVRGLPSFTCPECGSDLRQVGIRTAGQPRPLGPWTRAALWTLILPVPATIISVLLVFTVLPTSHHRTDTLNLQMAGSPSGPLVRLRAEGRGLGPPPRSGTSPLVPLQRLTMTLGGAQAGGAPLEIDLRTMGYKCQPASGDVLEQSSGLDASVLRAWLTSAGVDTNDAAVQAALPELFTVVQNAAGGKLARGPGGTWQDAGAGTGTRTGSAGGVPLLGFWALIWLIGLWFCFRRRHAPAPLTR